MSVGENPTFAVEFEKDLLGGVMTLTSNGKYLCEGEGEEKLLYTRFSAPKFADKPLKWIPYYAWANRG